MTVTADPAALRRAAVVLFVVPAQTMRANVQAVAGALAAGAILVSASKGLEIGSALADERGDRPGAEPRRRNG